MAHELEGPLDLEELWSVLDGRATPTFKYIAWHTKTMKIALDIGPTDIKIRDKRFTMRWKGRGASQYSPQLALPVVSDLMRRASLHTVGVDVVAWMPSDTVPGDSGLPSFNPPDYFIWFVRRDDGLDVFTREPGEVPPPSEPGPIPPNGPLRLPVPWSSPTWRTYRDCPDGLACPHCHARAERFREVAATALVCASCGRSFEPRSGEKG